MEETEWPSSPDGDDDAAGAATPGSRGRPTRATSVLSGLIPNIQGSVGRGGAASESRPGMVNGIPLKDLAEKKPQYQVTFSVEFGEDMLDEES